MINKLTDTHIRKAAWPGTKSLSDGKGLRVILTAKSKVFQFRYQRPVNKKINNLVIGHYPSMTLKKAREVAQRYRDFLLDGVDPQYGKISKSVDFDALAKNYFKVQKSKWTNGHYKTQKGRYEKYIKAPFGNRDIESVSAFDIYTLLESIAQLGLYQTAEKLSVIIKGAFDSGIALGLVKYNPAVGVMKQVTVTKRTKAMPHFNLTKKGEAERLGSFLRDINNLKRTSLAVKTALVLAPYVFMRSGVLSALKVSSFDRENKWLLINAMDMKSEHTDFIVPLSTQAFALIDSLIGMTQPKMFVFQTSAGRKKHISQEAISNAKKRAGWDFDDVTIHGLRHTATTYLTEIGFDYEVTELQLHHKLSGVRGVYNKAIHIEKRREMMQVWADYLDSLK